MQELHFLRERAILARTQFPRRTFHDQIKSGLMPRGVKLGPRAVAYPKHEVDAVLAARFAGKTDDEIRSLVAELEASRAGIAEAMGVHHGR